MAENTKRFSNRVADYTRFRPSYPEGLIAYLTGDGGLTNQSIVADIGSGTGIFTRLLVNKVKTVYAVEPNNEMRQAAEQLIINQPAFQSVNGKAEASVKKNIDRISWINYER